MPQAEGGPCDHAGCPEAGAHRSGSAGAPLCVSGLTANPSGHDIFPRPKKPLTAFGVCAWTTSRPFDAFQPTYAPQGQGAYVSQLTKNSYLMICSTSDGLIARSNGVVTQLQFARRTGLVSVVYLHQRS